MDVYLLLEIQSHLASVGSSDLSTTDPILGNSAARTLIASVPSSAWSEWCGVWRLFTHGDTHINKIEGSGGPSLRLRSLTWKVELSDAGAAGGQLPNHGDPERDRVILLMVPSAVRMRT